MMIDDRWTVDRGQRCRDKPISISILPNSLSQRVQLHDTIIAYFAADETRGLAKVKGGAGLRPFASEQRAESCFNAGSGSVPPLQPPGSETSPHGCSAAASPT